MDDARPRPRPEARPFLLMPSRIVRQPIEPVAPQRAPATAVEPDTDSRPAEVVTDGELAAPAATPAGATVEATPGRASAPVRAPAGRVNTAGSPSGRVLPAVQVGLAPRVPPHRPARQPAAATGVSTPEARGARPAVGARPAIGARTGAAAATKRPYHVGVAIGLSAGVYAASLASVSLLQIDHDRALIADRQPVSDAIALLGRHNDETAASLSEAGLVFEDASTHYSDLASGMQALHDDLVTLSRRLNRIGQLLQVDRSGLGALPRVSGGGGTAAAPVPKSAPKAGNAAPPPVATNTGASGAP